MTSEVRGGGVSGDQPQTPEIANKSKTWVQPGISSKERRVSTGGGNEATKVQDVARKIPTSPPPIPRARGGETTSISMAYSKCDTELANLQKNLMNLKKDFNYLDPEERTNTLNKLFTDMFNISAQKESLKSSRKKLSTTDQASLLKKENALEERFKVVHNEIMLATAKEYGKYEQGLRYNWDLFKLGHINLADYKKEVSTLINLFNELKDTTTDLIKLADNFENPDNPTYRNLRNAKSEANKELQKVEKLKLF